MVDHPSRSAYAAGCHCAACRAANSAYQRRRLARQEPRLTDAQPIRDHILRLSAAHIGRRAIADACDLAPSTIQAIRSGKRQVIYTTTAQRILAVDETARADSSLVTGTETRAIIRQLQRDGYTVRFLSKHLGFSRLPVYSHSPRIKARTASRVERFVRLLEQGRISRP